MAADGRLELRNRITRRRSSAAFDLPVSIQLPGLRPCAAREAFVEQRVQICASISQAVSRMPSRWHKPVINDTAGEIADSFRHLPTGFSTCINRPRNDGTYEGRS